MIIKYYKDEKVNLDLHQLINSINKKEDILKRIIDHFKSNIQNFQSEIEKSFNSDNIEELRFHIHKIKSEVGNIGAFKAQYICNDISFLLKDNNKNELRKKIDELEFELNKINDYFENNNADELIKQFG
jgi:HPt (histidine-containing phosphotransfer) domain-containing protein